MEWKGTSPCDKDNQSIANVFQRSKECDTDQTAGVVSDQQDNHSKSGVCEIHNVSSNTNSSSQKVGGFFVSNQCDSNCLYEDSYTKTTFTVDFLDGKCESVSSLASKGKGELGETESWLCKNSKLCERKHMYHSCLISGGSCSCRPNGEEGHLSVCDEGLIGSLKLIFI
ncbi:peroxisomal targeting signal 1 receptor [Plakobranchus ocellatus]|uniref:Peroxisomal targeting signal 1 receptor n=1 Tax=Plakobranchus ocellatus TaxID=259542 RepID=A0AAV4BS67_9GAST|nr:peroxisomal targeting signal 1 receptor [Plakobranchus ocellatus]